MIFTIRLTPNEVFIASHHALMRRWVHLVGIAQERTPRNNQSRVEWDNDINSSCAEMAFAKKIDRYWTGISNLKGPDTNWGEVRWTRLEGKGGLIIYPNDPDDRRFVLMDGWIPEYNLIGWLRGKEGKELGTWDSVKEYYLVPREDIRKFTPRAPSTESAESPEPEAPQSAHKSHSGARTNEVEPESSSSHK